MIIATDNDYAFGTSIYKEIKNNGEDTFYFKFKIEHDSLIHHIDMTSPMTIDLEPGETYPGSMITTDIGPFKYTYSVIGQGEDEGVIVSKTAIGIWLYTVAIIIHQYYE
jgi:hypothetical protein